MPDSFKIYVISLVDAVYRRENLKEKMQSLSLPYEIIDGVDGRALTPKEYPHYDRSKRLWLFGRDLKGGEIGCLLSHKAALLRVAQDNQPALILEDDVALSPAIIPVIQQLLKTEYKWGLIRFLGSAKSQIIRQRTVLKLEQGYTVNRIATSPGGAYAYLVTPSGAKALLRHLNKVAYPIDTIMGRPWQTGLSVLSVKPALARQDEAIDSMIGDQRFSKSLDIRGLKAICFPVVRAGFRFVDSLLKRFIYWGSWPYDRFICYQMQKRIKE